MKDPGGGTLTVVVDASTGSTLVRTEEGGGVGDVRI